MKVRVLSFHAGYGCKHRGRCCTAGWPIAVEASERARLERAIAVGELTAARSGDSVFATAAPPRGRALLASSHGECVFHDDHKSGGCRIHRAIGHAALPLACRQFPRQSVHDPRGVSITLSHYCPTAGDALAAPAAPITVVDDAPAFPGGAEYIGLVADSALPPLLHPRLAMDWESWWTFEELSVALIDEAAEPLARLGLAVEYARNWAVGHVPLMTHVRQAFERARHASIPTAALPAPRMAERVADALAAVPAEWRVAATEAAAAPSSDRVEDIVMRRYLAAHAFASWAAYQGEGLRAWFRAVEIAASLLAQTADPGRADLILRHLVDSGAIVDRWNRAEDEPAFGAATRHP